MKTVMCFGTFDGLHKGHYFYLKQARKYGDKLVVVVARDSTVKQTKNTNPIRNQDKRLAEVKKCKLVDKAVLGYAGDKLMIIDEIKPDVLCLGYDQKAFTTQLKAKLNDRGLTPKIVRIKPHKPEIYKSSKLNKSI